jgi:Lrp/AsnC family transcriptional regulator for asnA, asnC and gidA
MYKIDNIDVKIVDLLMQDGRMACSEIARRIGGVTERAIRYRLDRLIENNIIFITAVVNQKAVGFPIVADVLLEVEADSIREVAERMQEYECVSYVAYSIGETDVSVQVIAKDAVEVYEFVTRVIGKTAGVRKTTTSIVPQVLKDVYQWRIPRSGCVQVSEEKNLVKPFRGDER